jgi:hypothetical protein
MRLRHKVTDILKSKSGISLMLVLGLTMLLMAIGLSVFAAASANIGSNIRQNEYSRVKLLGNSIHRVMMYSLQQSSTDPDVNPEYLNEQVAMEIVRFFQDPDREPEDELLIEIDTNIGIPIPGNLEISRITLSFPFMNIISNGPSGYVPAITGVSGAIERIPREDVIEARMIVSVEITALGFIRAGEDRLFTVEATYIYNGVLSDRVAAEAAMIANPDNPLLQDDNHIFPPMRFDGNGLGESGFWEMIGYEIVESQVT